MSWKVCSFAVFMYTRVQTAKSSYSSDVIGEDTKQMTNWNCFVFPLPSTYSIKFGLVLVLSNICELSLCIFPAFSATSMFLVGHMTPGIYWMIFIHPSSYKAFLIPPFLSHDIIDLHAGY